MNFFVAIAVKGIYRNNNFVFFLCYCLCQQARAALRCVAQNNPYRLPLFQTAVPDPDPNSILIWPYSVCCLQL